MNSPPHHYTMESTYFNQEYINCTEVVLHRDILSFFVLVLTGFCFYLLVTRDPSFHKEKSANKNIKKDIDDNDEIEDSDAMIDSMMSMVRSKTDRKDTENGSGAQIEAMGVNVTKMLGTAKELAMGSNSSREHKQLIEGMFSFMEGASKSFMDQMQDVSRASSPENVDIDENSKDEIIDGTEKKQVSIPVSEAGIGSMILEDDQKEKTQISATQDSVTQDSVTQDPVTQDSAAQGSELEIPVLETPDID